MNVKSEDVILGKIKEVFLYDSDTTVGLGFKEAGTRKGFKLTNSSRTLVIKCFKVNSFSIFEAGNISKFKDWLNSRIYCG